MQLPRFWEVVKFLIPNVRRLSSQTFPFMGMFDWEEGLIPLAQPAGDNALTDAIR